MVKALSLTSGILPGNLHKTSNFGFGLMAVCCQELSYLFFENYQFISRRKRVERVVQLTAVNHLCVQNHCILLKVLHIRFLTHWYDRFDEKSYLEEKEQGPYSQQGSLFANLLAATLQSPCLLPYTGPIDLRVTLSRLMTSSHQLL
ncbi:hypothetical protein DAPPUDRAFT_303587 [Daphnia pulex]|uniref:Uncharacterized protein n=1 Tax=Daphnia pulex TaxID=6669 RepID=E9HRS7_DAPPU|nr:hypothetical protein DAPPUDRAFT_303587 [Daphnia pulex]|eukprot:EFX65553.1 hypothetical protein DAPPUDRAFT_303587 [Daphnia pulex]